MLAQDAHFLTLARNTYNHVTSRRTVESGYTHTNLRAAVAQTAAEMRNIVTGFVNPFCTSLGSW